MVSVKYYMHILEGVFENGCIAKDTVFALFSRSLKLPDEALSLRFLCSLILAVLRLVAKKSKCGEF